jgi:hypothetical protein
MDKPSKGLLDQVPESEEYEGHMEHLGKTLKKPSIFSDLVDNDTSIPEWEKNWKGMPEFEQQDDLPYKKLYVTFRNEEDYQEFAKLIGQKLTPKTKTIWIPELEHQKMASFRWVEDSTDE